MAKRRKSYYGGASKFFFGWFVGIVVTLVLIVGIGYWVIFRMPVSSATNLVGVDLPLNDQAKSNSLADFVGTAVKTMNGSSNDSIETTAYKLGIDLGGVLTVSGSGESKTYSYKGLDLTSVIKGKISEISSNVNNVIETISISNILSIAGISLPDNIPVINDEDIKSAALKDLGEAISNKVNNYTLNDIAEEFGVSGLTNNDILKCIADKKISELSDAINDLTVGDVITVSEGDKILNTIKDVKIVELGSQAESKVKGLMISDVVEVGDNNVLQAIASFKIGELSEKFNTLKVVDIFPDPEEGAEDTRNEIIIAIKDVALVDLGGDQVETEVKKLTIADFIDVGDNKILNAIRDTMIGDLSTRFQNITVGELFPADDPDTRNIFIKKLDGVKVSALDSSINDIIDDMFVSEILGDYDDTNPILNKIADYRVGELSDRISDLTLGDIFPAPEEGEDDRYIIIQKLEDVKLTELDENIEDTVNGLKLNELITVSNDNTIFSTIGDTTIGGLDTRVKNLTVDDLFPADDPDTRNSIIKALGSKKLNELDQAIDDLALGEIMDSSKFSSGIPSLLYVVKGGTRYEKDDIPLSLVGDAVDNLTVTVKNLSLSDLKVLGLLDIADAILLAPVHTSNATEFPKDGGGYKTQKGELTMSEFIIDITTT